MQTNEIFLLVGEVISQIVSSFLSPSSSSSPPPSVSIPTTTKTSSSSSFRGELPLSSAGAPFADFVQEPWWDVAIRRDRSPERSSCDVTESKNSTPEASDSVAAHMAVTSPPAPLPETLRALCEESCRLLRSALAPLSLPPEVESALLTPERFGKIVGMFEQNNVGIFARSPIPAVLRQVLKGESVGEVVAAGVDKISALVSLIDERRGGGEDDASESECCSSEEGEVEVVGDGSDRRPAVCRGADTLVDHSICQEESSGVSSTEFCNNREKKENDEESCPGEVTLMADNRTSCSAVRHGGDRSSERGGGIEETKLPVELPAVDHTSGDPDPMAYLKTVIPLDYECLDHDNLFTALDGTALYTLICCMNHSCRPSCTVRYPGRRFSNSCSNNKTGTARADPLVAEVVLIENVSPGDELTLSYVVGEMDLRERRAALQDYGFKCSCPRCQEEAEK